MIENPKGEDDFDSVCRLAEELAQSIVKMRACRCHGTGVAVVIVEGDIVTAPCACASEAAAALDKWKATQARLCGLGPLQ